MEQNKSILLQKQVRDNTEDLQKELLDLNNWEKEMKRKEAALLKADNNKSRVLPPIRSKKQKTIVKSPEVPSTSKAAADRIKSSDYSAWDQFDVDAACRKIDEGGESDGSVEDVQETAEKKHTEATTFKEQGNAFVKKGLYDKAVAAYTEAIKMFPYDEVFYANRALCYLKMDNLYSAEADCTAALQMNAFYVKAYHRRAKARMALKEYEEAKQDIVRMLDLEPTNKEAKAMLAQVNKKFEKPKILTSKTPVEKRIGDKIWNTAKLKEETAIQKQQILEIKKVKESSKGKGVNLERDVSNDTGDKLPDWLPNLDDNFGIVKPVELSPHQRSKKPLKRIPIKEVDFGDKILPKHTLEVKENEKINERFLIERIEKPSPEKQSEVEKPITNSDMLEHTNVNEKQILYKRPEEYMKNSNLEDSKVPKMLENSVNDSSKKDDAGIKNTENLKIIEIVDEIPRKADEKSVNAMCGKSNVVAKANSKIEIISSSVFVPPVPKTAVQFLMDWKRNKSADFRNSYLKQIPPETIPQMFKDSMESDIFCDIISVLRTEFIPNKINVYQYLENLSSVKRFRALIMFIERSTKEDLKELLVCCKTQEGISDDKVDELRKKYEL